MNARTTAWVDDLKARAVDLNFSHRAPEDFSRAPSG